MLKYVDTQFVMYGKSQHADDVSVGKAMLNYKCQFGNRRPLRKKNEGKQSPIVRKVVQYIHQGALFSNPHKPYLTFHISNCMLKSFCDSTRKLNYY